MIDRATGRVLCRLLGVLAMTGLIVGCAGTPNRMAHAPADFGKDQVSRAERLVGYCERLAGEGKYLTALGLCARAHELNPDDPETMMKIAALLQTLDRDDAAVQTYAALLNQHPGHQEALYSLGKAYMESGRLDQAALQFNRAMTGDPEDPRPYNALGIIRDQAGEHQAAQALYRSALVQDPSHVSARNNLGLSLALTGNRDEAIEVLAEAAVEPGVSETVLHNLDAAYATTSVMPPGDGKEPAEPAPTTPGLAPQAINRPAVPVEVGPLQSRPLEDEGYSKVPAEGPEGGQSPIPLIAPATAGELEQTSALPTEAVIETPRVGIPDARSVIAAAAAVLLKPPAWADFEPGILLSALPPASPRTRVIERTMTEPENALPAETAPQEADGSVDRSRKAPDPYYLSANRNSNSVAAQTVSAEPSRKRAEPYFLSMLVLKDLPSNG